MKNKTEEFLALTIFELERLIKEEKWSFVYAMKLLGFSVNTPRYAKFCEDTRVKEINEWYKSNRSTNRMKKREENHATICH
jgi:hypothetical protein